MDKPPLKSAHGSEMPERGGHWWHFGRTDFGWTYLAFLQRKPPNQGSYHINFTWVHGHLAIVYIFGLSFWEHPQYREWDAAHWAQVDKENREKGFVQ